MSAWLQTQMGRTWSLSDHARYSYNVEEIAHALGQTCRYAGQTATHYSEAQHASLVAREVGTMQLGLDGDAHARIICAALLSSAPLAYLGTLPPHVAELPEYAIHRQLCAIVGSVISRQFFDGAADAFEHPAIEKARRIVLATEARDVLGLGDAAAAWDPDLPPPSRVRIAACFDAKNASQLYLGQFHAWRTFDSRKL